MSESLVLRMEFRGAELPSVRSLVEEATLRTGLATTVKNAFAQAALEVATNAVTHGGGSGIVELRLLEGELRCEIKDSGAGRRTVGEHGGRRADGGPSHRAGDGPSHRAGDGSGNRTGGGPGNRTAGGPGHPTRADLRTPHAGHFLGPLVEQHHHQAGLGASGRPGLPAGRDEGLGLRLAASLIGGIGRLRLRTSGRGTTATLSVPRPAPAAPPTSVPSFRATTPTAR